MSIKIFKRLACFIVSVIIIIAAFSLNIFAGLLALAVIILTAAFLSRAYLFALLGSRAYTSGHTSKALNFYKRAYSTRRCKPVVVISYAYLLLKAGKTEDAGKILNTLANSGLNLDDKMNAKSNLALVAWKKGNIDEALEILEEVYKTYKNTTVYGSLGYMLILKGDLERALAFNLEAYEYNNNNNVIQDNLGQTYFLRGEYDKAEEIYASLMSTNPGVPGINYNYGLLLASTGRHEKALEYMKKALSLDINPLSGVTEEEIRNKIQQLEEGMAG